MLCCNVKGCTANNFPLVIKATSVETIASEFNKDLVLNLLPKLEWTALVAGCRDVWLLFGGLSPSLPFPFNPVPHTHTHTPFILFRLIYKYQM